MLTKQSLYTLLNIDPSPNAPVISVYADQQSNRLSYVCEFIFKHALKCNYKLYTNIQEFEDAKGLKINYSKTNNSSSFQIFPAGLLEQKEILEFKPEVLIKNDCLYFYEREDKSSNDSGSLHFDIFSAVFYLISRYEEWQSFTPDVHGRFEITQSILYKNKFHLKPLVEIWIEELKTTLQVFFPAFSFPETHFQVLSTIDVDNLYAYKSKGFFRSMGASLKDVVKGDLKNLSQRIRVLIGKLPDPFDIYQSVSDFCFEKKIPLIYFFLFKTGDRYNRTIDPSTGVFKEVFRTLKKNFAFFGLHPSYDAAYNSTLLELELKDLSHQSGETISFSRQHYLRFDIKTTPINLVRQGILADFTMGYASQAGFRAGTSLPFYYFDFNSEKQTDLLFVPFCVMDGAYTIYKNTDPDEALKQMLLLAQEIKKVNGIFISVFHERSFSDHLYPGFGTLYKKLHAHLKAL